MGIKVKIKELYFNNPIIRRNLYWLYFKLAKNSKKISGNSNEFEISDASLKNVKIHIIGDNNKIVIAKGSMISNMEINMYGSGHTIIIGENCILKSGTLWLEDSSCKIIIGGSTTIEDAHIAATEPNSIIEIGEDCMFSSEIDIRNGDSHSIIDLSDGRRINYAKNIKIEGHVWLGKSVKVLKGAHIGSNSIIGTGSLITKNIPGNCVAVGVPAKVVKENVSWDRARIFE